jgi:membrane associated rhomboid family serine protease/Flp pilus assembly protein TadD
MANCIRCGRQLPGLTFGKKICQWCVQHEAYQRGEIVDNAKQPVMRTPWVRRGESTISLTQIIFGMNVAVFLGMALGGSTIMEFSGLETIRWGANWGPLTLNGEWWRLLTCVFVHGGIIHIAFNMWCLWNLGALAESLYGRWTYAAIYLTCGIGASLGSVAWHPGTPSVGASGAIFGLAGALIAAFKLGEFSVPRSALSGTLRSLAMFVIYNLIFGAVIGTTDNAAHIGGLITGLIMGALIALIAPQQGQDVKRLAILAALIVALAGGAMGLARYHGLPLRLGRATMAQEDGQPGRTIARLQDIVKQRPTFVRGHFELAQAYFSHGDYARAEPELRRVIELDPKQSNARTLLGMVYLNENRPQDAKDAFAQELSQDSNNAEAHYGMGLVLAGEGNHLAAIEEFKTAAHIDPRAGGVNFNLGVSYSKINQTDNAIAAFLKERQLSGDDYDLETALAAAYQAKGMTQESAEAKRKAAELRAAQ